MTQTTTKFGPKRQLVNTDEFPQHTCSSLGLKPSQHQIESTRTWTTSIPTLTISAQTPPPPATRPPPTCEGFDARALEQASRAVLIVPVVGVPAVVDAFAVLLLDLHVVVIRRHRRHLDLAATPAPAPLLLPRSNPSTCELLR